MLVFNEQLDKNSAKNPHRVHRLHVRLQCKRTYKKSIACEIPNTRRPLTTAYSHFRLERTGYAQGANTLKNAVATEAKNIHSEIKHLSVLQTDKLTLIIELNVAYFVFDWFFDGLFSYWSPQFGAHVSISLCPKSVERWTGLNSLYFNWFGLDYWIWIENLKCSKSPINLINSLTLRVWVVFDFQRNFLWWIIRLGSSFESEIRRRRPPL